MPAFANSIAIYDGETTPVVHTFNPESRNGNEVNYVDRASGVSVGFSRLKVSHNLASKGSPLNKIRVRLSIPELETVAGDNESGFTPAPKLAFVATFSGEFIFHERATTQQRKNLRMLIANFLQTTGPIAMLDGLEPAY